MDMTSYAVESYASDIVNDAPEHAPEARNILAAFRQDKISAEDAWKQLDYLVNGEGKP